MITKMLAIVIASMFMATAACASNDPLKDLVDGSNDCRKFASVEDEILVPFVKWLVGYRDGLAALSRLDKRLAGLPQDPLVLGALVLSSCHASPHRSIAEAANDVFERLINSHPGRRLTLSRPR